MIRFRFYLIFIMINMDITNAAIDHALKKIIFQPQKGNY